MREFIPKVMKRGELHASQISFPQTEKRFPFCVSSDKVEMTFMKYKELLFIRVTEILISLISSRFHHFHFFPFPLFNFSVSSANSGWLA